MITLSQSPSAGKETPRNCIYQNREMKRIGTSINPTTPFVTKITLSQHVQQEIPIDVIVSLFNV